VNDDNIAPLRYSVSCLVNCYADLRVVRRSRNCNSSDSFLADR